MAETLTGETKDSTKTDQETEVSDNLTVADQGIEDSKRWAGEDTEALPIDLELVPVGVGVRGLGRFNVYRHRVESVALPTGHLALRGKMPEFVK